MLAILGLMGIALSAVMIIDTTPDPDGSDGEADDGVQRVPVTDITDLSLEDDAVDIAVTEPSDEGETPHSAEGVSVSVLGESEEGSASGGPVVGSADDDDLEGTDYGDSLHGEDGDDALLGLDGDDTLSGGNGDDWLDGGDGDDLLYGGQGDDTLVAGDGADRLFGGEGEDALFGGAGDDEIYSLDEDGDRIDGGAGADHLFVGDFDRAYGGEGGDTFSIIEDAKAVIGDFDAAEDRIEILYHGVNPPQLSLDSGALGTGLYADGTLVATFRDVSDIDLDSVILVAA